MIVNQSIIYLRAFLFFFYSSVVIIISFLPLYLEKIGLSGSEIGILLAIGPIGSLIFQPFWGYYSDKYNTIKRFIVFLLLMVLLTVPLIFITTTFYKLIPVFIVFYTFFSSIGGLGDSLAQQTSVKYNVSFGSIRTWGSIGFAITGIINGYILSVIGIKNIIYPFLFYGVIAFILLLKVSDVDNSGHNVKLADTKKIFKNKDFMLFLVIMSLVAITHRTNDSYIGILISSLGGDESLIGWAWFTAVSSEAIVFATSRYWLSRFNDLSIIIFSSILFGVKWLLFSMTSSPYIIIGIQFLHGVTFAAFYITAFQFITNLIPKELKTTGQLLYSSIFFGFSGIIGSLFGGFFIDIAGTSRLYLYLSILAFTASVLFIIYRHFFNLKNDKIVKI